MQKRRYWTISRPIFKTGRAINQFGYNKHFSIFLAPYNIVLALKLYYVSSKCQSTNLTLKISPVRGSRYLIIDENKSNVNFNV